MLERPARAVTVIGVAVALCLTAGCGGAPSAAPTGADASVATISTGAFCRRLRGLGFRLGRQRTECEFGFGGRPIVVGAGGHGGGRAVRGRRGPGSPPTNRRRRGGSAWRRSKPHKRRRPGSGRRRPGGRRQSRPSRLRLTRRRRTRPRAPRQNRQLRRQRQRRGRRGAAGGNGCTIKGNINSKGERIYHVDGKSPSYDETVIDESAGERWFCSEAEARPRDGVHRKTLVLVSLTFGQPEPSATAVVRSAFCCLPAAET